MKNQAGTIDEAMKKTSQSDRRKQEESSQINRQNNAQPSPSHRQNKEQTRQRNVKQAKTIGTKMQKRKGS